MPQQREYILYIVHPYTIRQYLGIDVSLAQNRVPEEKKNENVQITFLNTYSIDPFSFRYINNKHFRNKKTYKNVLDDNEEGCKNAVHGNKPIPFNAKERKYFKMNSKKLNPEQPPANMNTEYERAGIN